MNHNISFTGTRKGMNARQKKALTNLLGLLKMATTIQPVFYHGGCIGADEEAAIIATELGYLTYEFPSNMKGMRTSFVSDRAFSQELPPLERNKLIVDNGDLLIACPEGPEVRRSGTWATIRYALKQEKEIEIIGHVEGYDQAYGVTYGRIDRNAGD